MRASARTGDFDELRVVTAASWLARDLAAAGTLPVVGDLGLDVPAEVSRTAWWCSGAFAARLTASGLDVPLLGPPASWQARMLADVLGRQLHAAPFGEAADRIAACQSGVFAKVADVKLPALYARWWDEGAQFVTAALVAGLTPSTPVLWTTRRVTFAREYRCFVADGAVTAASVYLEGERTWDAWQTGDEPPAGHAVGFAEQVLRELDDQPPGWVLDVGQDADGTWHVVEANPSWCANPYHCDPAGVVASVLAAHDPHRRSPQWRWQPGEVLMARARPLPVRRPVV